MDTIFALSTAQGKAGVAIIRISGPLAFEAVLHLAGDIPEPRRASLRILKDSNGVRLDQALILCFKHGESFTGEDVAELHLHGSPAVVSAVSKELSSQVGLRAAEPGEFTRRALENGCLDMAQVEGLADLLDAETEAQRRQALRVLSGDLGRVAEEWRRKLIRAAALLEATIDFADEEVPENVIPEVSELTNSVMVSLRSMINGVQMSERIRQGFEVAIVGAPNMGKSTLLNTLAGREAAITSQYVGTTRDVIEVRMDLGGLPVTLLDTAGLRETEDAVESIGILRARERAASADLRVFLITEDTLPDMAVREGDIVLLAKADLQSRKGDSISGLTGEGVPELVERIKTTLQCRAASAGLATRVRHASAMERGLRALEVAESLFPQGEVMADLAAEEIRTAIRALDSLVGRIDVEMVLDEIFASFCLGK